MIVGAGLAGLITAHVFPRHAVVEAATEPLQMHKAVLRFRNESVSNLVGIPFKAVTVRKGVWWERKFVPADIGLANLYSDKCLGGAVRRAQHLVAGACEAIHRARDAVSAIDRICRFANLLGRGLRLQDGSNHQYRATARRLVCFGQGS